MGMRGKHAFIGRAEQIGLRLFPHELELLNRLGTRGRSKADTIRAGLKALAEIEGVEVPSPVGKNKKAASAVSQTVTTAL